MNWKIQSDEYSGFVWFYFKFWNSFLLLKQKTRLGLKESKYTPPSSYFPKQRPFKWKNLTGSLKFESGRLNDFVRTPQQRSE